MNGPILVILGGWNVNIVSNPDWLKRYLFPDAERLKLELRFSAAEALSPCVTAGDIRISLTGGRLGLGTAGEGVEDFDKIQGTACKLADFLPHTPVSAYGVNFIFATTLSDPAFSNQGTMLHRVIGEIGPIVEEESRYSVTYKGTVLNLKAKEAAIPEGGRHLELNFNFHRLIPDLSQLKAGLDSVSVQECFTYSKELAYTIEQQATRAVEEG